MWMDCGSRSHSVLQLPVDKAFKNPQVDNCFLIPRNYFQSNIIIS